MVKEEYAADLDSKNASLRRLEITNTMPIYHSLAELNPRFGAFGGRYIPETLLEAHRQLEQIYVQASQDPAFQLELESYGRDYVGRPTPLYFAERLTRHVGGAKIFIKREDLAHTGAHKINNALAQVLLARRIGKQRIIAETGAGQHGVATATACALCGLKCVIYMGAEDIERQKLNVFRMKLLGAEVISVTSGTKTLKDAVNEAMRDWTTNVRDTHYIIGSAIGPHPFPTIVRDFQSVIGRETIHQCKAQFAELGIDKKYPDEVYACVGGGSNAIGMFYPFINNPETKGKVKLVGVEAGGLHGIENSDKHCATLSKGKMGVFQGTKSYVLQDKNGQISETHSISAGLDYPGVGPEHAFLKDECLAVYESCTDGEALKGLEMLARTEGIIAALESSHAVYNACMRAKALGSDKIVVINLSGRGDKDMVQVAKTMGVDI